MVLVVIWTNPEFRGSVLARELRPDSEEVSEHDGLWIVVTA